MIKELAEDIHKNAVAHGFWENDISRYELYALIVSEVMELFEAYRKGGLQKQCNKKISLTCEQEEIADIAIRCLDVLEGVFSNVNYYNLDRVLKSYQNGIKNLPKLKTIPDIITFTEIKEVLDLYRNNKLPVFIGEFFCNTPRFFNFREFRVLIVFCKFYADENGFNLWDAVKIKHEYNKTRPYKHGKVC